MFLVLGILVSIVVVLLIIVRSDQKDKSMKAILGYAIILILAIYIVAQLLISAE
jgi:4-amino-4-deoxy-L-arabinose transferase-like glycosyltransferase